MLSNFNPPVNKAIVPFASAFMELMPKKLRGRRQMKPHRAFSTYTEADSYSRQI